VISICICAAQIGVQSRSLFVLHESMQSIT